jgi:diguanylate cyclase (GGDEF)-like protein
MSKKNRPNTVALLQPGSDLQDRTYREVFDHMEQGVVVWSDQLACTLVNKRYYELVGLSESDLRPGDSVADYYQRLVSLGRIDQTEARNSVQNFERQVHFSFQRTTPAGVILSFVGRPLSSGGLVVTLTDITEATQASRDLNISLERAESAESRMAAALAEEKRQRDEANLLAMVSDWLHSCETLSEVFDVVHQAMVNIYPHCTGELYVYSNSRDILELATTWGDGQPVSVMRPGDCWSLRRGRAFQFGDGPVRLSCAHVTESYTHEAPEHYLCMPIIAHGDTVGLLHLDFSHLPPEQGNAESADNVMQFVTRLAEQVSMAVANVRLRDELHRQSTLDSLTGMFNRRCFFDHASALLARQEAAGASAGVVLFDVDNFKQFNDRFGHDAGDRVLIEMSRLAGEYFDDIELISRIGGEEFALILPDISLEKARQRIAGFASLVSEHSIFYGNGTLPPCSISAGLAIFPNHAQTIHELIKKADEAMYNAKHEGKNCVCIAGGEVG